VTVNVPCSCDTLDKIKTQLPKLRKDLDDTAKFQAIYKYAFQFAKEGEQKCIGKLLTNLH